MFIAALFKIASQWKEPPVAYQEENGFI